MQATGIYVDVGDAAVRGRIAPPLVLILFGIDLALILSSVLMQLSGYKVHLFTLSAEQRIPNWYSTVKLLALAQLLAFLAWTIPVTTRPAFWVLLAPVALFTLLSIEEAVSVHERFERAVVPLLGGSGIGGYWSLMLGLPLAAAMVAIGIAYARLVHASFPTLAKAMAGATVFLAGSVAVDITADFIERNTIARVLAAALEEGGELVGVTFLIWAALDLAKRDLTNKAQSRLPRAAVR